jgi:ABC-type bacteriocin/lantibiotic exporter with double-glycine peptidase domain
MLTPLIVQCVQQEEAHCGPATIAMLFSFYGLSVSQTGISRAAGMADVIKNSQGMRLDELNMAIEALYPDGDYALLAKYHSDIGDITHIVEDLRLPIGVEWQGRFPRPDGSQYDQGHFSVITAIDHDRGILFIADPEDHNILTTDGVIDLDVFENRWWEVDVVPRPDDFSVARVIEMERLIFVLVPQRRKEPLFKLGFRPATLSLVWELCTPLEPID